MAQLKPDAVKIFNIVTKASHENKHYTAEEIARFVFNREVDNADVRKINGIITGAFINRKNLKGERTPVMERVKGEIEVEDVDGRIFHKLVKFIEMTEYGLTQTVDSLDEEDNQKQLNKIAKKDAQKELSRKVV